MALIKVHSNFLSNKFESYELASANLLNWLSESNHKELSNGALVLLNGKVIADSAKHDDMDDRCDVNVGLFDSVDIYSRPNGVESFLFPGISLGLYATQSIIQEIGRLFQQDLPTIDADNSRSNNALNAAQNGFRKNEAIADIAGKVVSYPDFIQPSFYEWINNRKVFKELFLIGIGRYLTGDVKDGTANIASTTGSSATFYDIGAGDVVPDEIRKSVVPSNSIDGEELNAPDSKVFQQTVSTEFYATDAFKLPLTSTIIEDFDWAIDSWVRILNANNAGDYQIISITEVVDGYEIVVDGPILQLLTYDADYINVRNEATPPAEDIQPIDGWTDWIIIRENTTGTDDVWFHLVMPEGIQDEDGDRIEINVEMEVRCTTSGTPTTYAMDYTFAGADRTQKGATVKLSDEVVSIPALATADLIEVRARRSTNEFAGAAAQSVKFEECVYVVDQGAANYGDVTLLYTTRKQTTFALGGRNNKINVEVTRKLELFDPLTGTFDIGTFTATRSAAQYAMYILNTQMKVSLANIDYEELFDIEDSLSDVALGRFDYTFDKKDISPHERLAACLNVMRSSFYQVGNNYKYIRYEERSVRAALFNRRNVAPQSSSLKIQPTRTGDFDSIEIQYVDPDKNTEAFVRRRLNPSTGAVETGTGERVNKINLIGCRNYTQATNRAEIEIRKIKYIRQIVSDKALSEALTIGVGQRVGWADFNDSQIFDGEILSQSGDEFLTTEKFEPVGGVAYYVYITDEDGNTSNSVVATAHPDTEFGFIATGLVAYTADGYTKQLGSRYFIASQQDIDAGDFILTDRGAPDSTGLVDVKLEQYDSRVFELD